MASKARRTYVSTRRVRQTVLRTLRAHAEPKYFITSQTATASTAAGTVIALTQDIVQGDQTNQRNGNQIELRMLDFRMNATLPAAGLAGGIRYMLVFDTRNTGSVPAVTDIIQTASPTSPLSILSTINRRYVVIMDEFLPMVVGGADQQIHIQWTKVLNRRITYNGTTDAAASNGTNALFLLVLTDLAANTPQYAFDAGMHYTDF